MANKRIILLIALLIGWFRTGDSIICYDSCIETTGDATSKAPGFGVTCLNKNPKDCGADVKHCYRATAIASKPYSYEMNTQRCGTSSEQKAECTPWTAREEGTYQGKLRECYCTGDKCNAATKGSGYLSAFFGLCIMWFIRASSGFAKA